MHRSGDVFRPWPEWSRVPDPSLNSPVHGSGCPERRSAAWPLVQTRGTVATWIRSSTRAGSERLARLPCHVESHCDASGVCGSTAESGLSPRPTWFLSGGRRKPPWSRTKLGEWSPRDEKSFYNRPGRENLQSRASDRKQVVRLGPLAWLSHPRLAGSSHPAGASPAVPQGAWNALGRPRSRGLS